MTEILVSITPGPAILLISSQGFKYGAKSSIFGSLGISSANLIYFILSALGIGTLIVNAGNLFHYIKICGALYLMFVGIRMFYKSFGTKTINTRELIRKQGNSKLFLQGLITQAANPKAILFFVALIPLFIDETKNMISQFSILAITTITVETSVLVFYGWLSARGRKKISKLGRNTKWQDRIAGMTLIGLGINLVIQK